MAAKVKQTKMNSKAKNIAKSLGYIGLEVAKDLNPTLGKIFSESKSAINDVKSSLRSMDNNSISETVKDFIDPERENIISNLIDDLKTGKWYNKEREEKAFFDDLGIDMDWDNEDWGDDDWGDDIDSDNVSDSVKSSASSVINGMQNLSASLSVNMGRASAKSAEYIAKSGHADSRAIYDMTRSGFGTVSTILLDMNRKMDGMMELGASLVEQSQDTTTFQTNAVEFFENTNEHLKNINASLERIAENTSILKPGGRKYESKSLNSLIFGDEFDFGGYIDLLKENVKYNIDTIKSFGEMGQMMMGKGCKNIGSPIAKGLSKGIQALIPKILKESMANFNTVIEGAIPMLLKNIKKDIGGGPLGFLTDIFLPDTEYKKRVSPSNYEKGPVAWDGVARKSVVEVIPTYLAKIYAALGGQEKYYNYGTGKFETIKEIRDASKNFREGSSLYAAKSASYNYRGKTGNVYDDVIKNANGDIRLEKELDKFFRNIGEIDDFEKIRSKNMDDNLLKKLGISKDAAKVINDTVDMYQKSKNATAMMKFSMAILASQNRVTEQMKREEESGHSSFNHLENDFSSQTDKFGVSQSQYLRGIYQMMSAIYNGMGGKGGYDCKTGNFKFKIHVCPTTFILASFKQHVKVFHNIIVVLGNRFGQIETTVEGFFDLHDHFQKMNFKTIVVIISSSRWAFHKDFIH